MQLHGPAWVLAVLGGEGLNEWGAEAGKLPYVVAFAVAQDGDGVGAASGGVVPALQRGGAEANIESGVGMAPRLGGKRLQ